jgi:hypothetical protein
MAYSKYDSELPWPMVRAAQLLKYDPGDCDISVTTLIGPARIRLLKTHPDYVHEEDIRKKGYAFGGTVMHHMLELVAHAKAYEVFEEMKDLDHVAPNLDHFKALCVKLWRAFGEDEKGMNRVIEKRFYIERAGVKIGGQMDLVYDQSGVGLWDYKMMSVWEVIFGVSFDKEAQANLYARILQVNGVEIDTLRIAAYLRDWKQTTAESGVDKNYPIHQIVTLPILRWDTDRVEKFIQQRINAHFMHGSLPDDLPECSNSEMWHQDKRWAVMKRGYDKALKVCYSHEDALEYQERTGKGDYIEFRPEQYTRCKSFCDVSHLCDQWKENKKRMDKQLDTSAPVGGPYG